MSFHLTTNCLSESLNRWYSLRNRNPNSNHLHSINFHSCKKDIGQCHSYECCQLRLKLVRPYRITKSAPIIQQSRFPQ